MLHNLTSSTDCYASTLGTLNANGQSALAVIDPGDINPGSGGVVLISDGNGTSGAPQVRTLILNSLSFVATDPNSLSFSGGAGETQSIEISVNGDSKVELNETMTVTLTSVTGTNDVTIVDNTGQGTIVNDDSATVSIGDAAVVEGGNLEFNVSLSNPVDVDTVINYSTADGSADGSDYTAASSSITIAGGQTSGTITVATTGDNTVELDETLTVNLTGVDANGRDVAGVSVVQAGTTTINFDGLAAMRNSPGATVPAAAQLSDQLLASTGAVFSSTSGTPYVAVVAVGGAVPSAPNAIGGVDAANRLSYGTTFTIEFFDPENANVPAVTDFVSIRGDLRSAPGTVTLRAFDVDGNEIAVDSKPETDAVLLSASVAGIHSVTISETTATCAWDNLTFGPMTAAASSFSATGTIVNDDSATVSIGDASVVEGGNLEFDVTLSNPVDVDTVVNYSTADGSATTTDSDYTGANSSITIAAGQTSGTITVASTDDNKVELDETIQVSLNSRQSDGRNVTLQQAVDQTVDLEDGSGHDVVIPFDHYESQGIHIHNGVWQGASGFRTGRFGLGVNAGLVGTNNWAFPGTTSPIEIEFLSPVSDVSIQAFGVGGSGAQIEAFDDSGNSLGVSNAVSSGYGSGYNPVLSVTADGIARIELTQHLYPAVSNDGMAWDSLSYSISGGGNGTIVNDDSATVSIGDASVTEGGNLEFAVSLSNPVDVDTVINYSTADGSAGGSDYTAASGSITIAAGQTSGTITVATTGDNTVEADETLSLNLTSVDASGRAVSIDDGTGNGTIVNDDSATVSIANASVAEGDAGDGNQLVFNVTLDNPVDVDVAFDYSTQDGTATAGDYTGVSGATLTIAAGATSAKIAIDVTGDNVLEADETLELLSDNLQASGRDVTLPSGTQGAADNLVVNGDFEAGNTGFTSDYRFARADTGAGVYDIVTDPRLSHGAFTSYGDHTSGNGLMFVANGSSTVGDAVWQQTITVAPHTDYDFAAYVSSAYPASPAQLVFDVNGATIGTLNASPTTGVWDLAFGTWNSGTATSATITIANVNTAGGGNDFALDDIYFGPTIFSAPNPVGTIVNDDAAPVANAGGAYVINEGDGLSLDASASSDADDGFAALTFRWDVDGNGDYDENVTGATPTLTSAQMAALGLNDGPDSRTVTVEASDGTNIDTATTTLTINNVAPSVVANGQQAVSIELVQNGEFENPTVGGSWTATNVPFWNNSVDGGNVEIWSSSVAGSWSPGTGSDGLPIGQQMESSVYGLGVITQTIDFSALPTGASIESLQLSFDAWTRSSGTATYDLYDVTTGMSLIGGPHAVSSSTSPWIANISPLVESGIDPSHTVQVVLTPTSGNGGSNVHFDQVSLTAEVLVGGAKVDEGGTATVDGSFSDPGQDVVTITASIGNVTQTAGSNGTWNWSFDTTDGPFESQTVTVTATDSDGATSQTTFDLVVNNVDPDFEAGADETLLPPVVGAFSRSLSFIDPGADSWTGTVNFGDGSGDQALTINQATKTFDLDHVFTADGTYTVSVTVNDDDGGTHSDSFVVTVFLNTPPVANDDDVSTDEDNAVTFNVLGNDTDEQNNIVASLTTALTSPSGGALTNNNDGTFSFNPDGDFESLPAGQSATVNFDYQIEDSFGETDSATATITVNGVNDAASISGDNAGAMTEDEAGDSGVMAVSDVDNGEDVFQAQSGTAGSYGDFSIDAAGNWSYARTANLDSMNAGDILTDSFTVVSADGTASEVVTVTITGVNDVASISGDNAGAQTEDDAGDSGVMAVSDLDDGEDVFQAQSGTVGSYGTFEIDAAGNWTYTRTANLDSMNAGDVLTDSFTVVSADGTASEVVTVTITGVNDVASISGDNVGTLTEDEAGDSGVMAVSDVDDGEDIFQSQTDTEGDYGDFSIDAAGNWSYTRTADLQYLAVGESVTDSFAVVSFDGTATATVTVTITGENDAPTIDTLISSNDDFCEASADGTVSVSGTFSDVDVSDTHSATVDWGDGTVESLTVDQLEDTLAGGHTYGSGGIYTVTVTIDDGNGGSDVESVTAVVSGAAVIDGTLYLIGTHGDDDFTVKQVNKKNPQIKVEYELNQIGGSDGGSDGGLDIPSLVFAGAGNDHITTGVGDDIVIGGAGNDKINGRGGNDILSGGAGDDKLDGGHGLDVLIGGIGKDHLKGDHDDDLLIGDSAANEENAAALEAAIAAWASGDLDAALLNLGDITDDGDKDKLQGGKDDDEVKAGDGDKEKDNKKEEDDEDKGKGKKKGKNK